MIILLVAGGLSGALGQRADASIIVTIVVLGVSINFWQAYRSTQAAERLRSSVVPNATVLRDGTWIETPLRDIVPGDLFRLSAGDMVPADARLLESRDLSVQQSMLTGESLPADKHAAATIADATGPDAPNAGLPRHVGGQRHRRRRWSTATGPRRPCSAISRRGCATAPPTPSSSSACIDSAC